MLVRLLELIGLIGHLGYTAFIGLIDRLIEVTGLMDTQMRVIHRREIYAQLPCMHYRTIALTENYFSIYAQLPYMHYRTFET